MKDFPRDIFRTQDISIAEYSSKPIYWIYSVSPSEFNIKTHEWFNEKQLRLNGAIVFFRRKNTDNGVPHVDHDEPDADGTPRFRTAGINLEFSGRATMNFYRGNVLDGKLLQASTKQNYYYFPDVTDDDIMDVNDFSTGTCIVRTDVIHKVVCQEVPRLLVSLRFSNLADNRRLSWDESIDRLKDYIVPRE